MTRQTTPEEALEAATAGAREWTMGGGEVSGADNKSKDTERMVDVKQDERRERPRNRAEERGRTGGGCHKMAPLPKPHQVLDREVDTRTQK